MKLVVCSKVLPFLFGEKCLVLLDYIYTYIVGVCSPFKLALRKQY